MKAAAEGRAKVLELLPRALSAELYMLGGGRSAFFERLEELRLRAPGKCSIVLGGAHRALQTRLTPADLEGVTALLCGGSRYAYEECIASGYIPFESGIRIGVCGRARYEGEVMRGICEIGALVIRFPHPHPEMEGMLADAFFGARQGLLIYAPPGAGKTTALRALARFLGTRVPPMRVTVIDERLEFCPEDYEDATVDILRGYHRAEALEIAYRSMNPEVVMLDEIGAEGEARALSALLRGGMRTVATAHANGREDLCRRGVLRPFWEQGCFDVFLGLKRENGRIAYDLYKKTESD